jgi:hypothetical protein
MKFGTDPIFESYVNHRKQFILEESVSNFYRFNPLQQIHDLYQYDLACIEELVTEGMLGDAFGKVKGGLEKATSYVANKGISLFLSLIKKFATPEDLKGIEQLKDPEKLKELAAKGMQTLNTGSATEEPVTNNEGVYLNKRFFASSILTESNIEVMLERYSFVNEQILSEAAKKSPKAADESLFAKDRQLKAAATAAKRSEAGKKGQAKAPYGSKAPKAKKTTEAEKPMQLSKYVKQVADELKKKYSQKQVSKFQGMLSKKLGTGVEQTSQRAPITSMPKRPTDISGGTNTSLVPTRAGSQANAQRQLGGGSASDQRLSERIPTVNVPSVTDNAGAALELPYTDVKAPETKSKEGIIRKAINWVRANPKRTAGTVLGIIAAIGIAVGGPAVLIPMLVKAGLFGTGALGTAATGAATGALAGAGIGAAKNIASQGFSNKQFSGKELGKAALKGGGKGAVVGAAGGLLKGMFDDHSASDTTTEPVKTSDTGDTEEGGDSDYTGGSGDVSATSSDFQKYNNEPLDPKSWRDKIKMAGLDKLKREGGGEIDANKYNSFVKKLVAMGKGAQGKSIESIMGESYTVQYLSLLK